MATIIVRRVPENSWVIYTSFLGTEVIFCGRNEHEKFPFIVPVESSKLQMAEEKGSRDPSIRNTPKWYKNVLNFAQLRVKLSWEFIVAI